jgi:hypothetical protein
MALLLAHLIGAMLAGVGTNMSTPSWLAPFQAGCGFAPPQTHRCKPFQTI